MVLFPGKPCHSVGDYDGGADGGGDGCGGESRPGCGNGIGSGGEESHPKDVAGGQARSGDVACDGSRPVSGGATGGVTGDGSRSRICTNPCLLPVEISNKRSYCSANYLLSLLTSKSVLLSLLVGWVCSEVTIPKSIIVVVATTVIVGITTTKLNSNHKDTNLTVVAIPQSSSLHQAGNYP